MNMIDALLGVVLAYSGFSGLRKGAVGIFLDIIAWMGGLFLAMRYTLVFSNWILVHFPRYAPYASVASFVGIWLFSFCLFSLLAFFIDKLLRGTFISPFDRVLGACIGLVKGLLIMAVLLYPLEKTQSALLAHAKLAFLVKPVTGIISQFLPL